MQKTAHRPRRRRSKAPRSPRPRTAAAVRRSGIPAPRNAPDARGLLDRILDTPHLARLVPQLQPQVLHRVIQSCGLEDCGALVALATPGQLSRVFDLDLWRAHQAGLDERFDADRFGVWLDVLMESGGTVAARTLAGVDFDLVSAAFAQHVLVFDPAARSPSASIEGDEMSAGRSVDDRLACDVGGYHVVARRTASWDAIVEILTCLDAEHHACFDRLMRECRSLSNSRPEVDGLDNLLAAGEQVMFDLASDREQRREQQGYVTPAEGRAFLQMSRQVRFGHESMPTGNPVARAYFRGIEGAAGAADIGFRQGPPAPGAPPVPESSADAVNAIVDLLLDAGTLPRPPRHLLDGAQRGAPRLARIQAQMQFAGERDRAAFSMRGQELAFLANTIVAGGSVQARPFTPQEASDAAVATCNLGLENWPPHWIPAQARSGASVLEAGAALPDDFLVGHDLITVFQVGLTVLHETVCMFAAERLIGVLAGLRCDDRETRAGLDALRVEMTRHWQAGVPWRARDALDVITSLDMTAWAALLGLIDECPVLHAALGASQGLHLRAISATAFEFISENSQIASVREFMQVLPETLGAR